MRIYEYDAFWSLSPSLSHTAIWLTIRYITIACTITSCVLSDAFTLDSRQLLFHRSYRVESHSWPWHRRFFLACVQYLKPVLSACPSSGPLCMPWLYGRQSWPCDNDSFYTYCGDADIRARSQRFVINLRILRRSVHVSWASAAAPPCHAATHQLSFNWTS